jgi:diguanylate cyclase (GGDEF)-like protein
MKKPKDVLTNEANLALSHTVLSTVTDGWWCKNFDTNEVFVSSNLKSLFEYDDTEIVNTTEGLIRLIDSDYLGAIEPFLNSATEQQVSLNEVIKCRSKEGSYKWLMMRGQKEFNEQGKIKQLVVTFVNITQLKAAEKELSMIAHTDPLTNLPNRSGFSQILQHSIAQSKREKSQLALLYIDLDNFKYVNDSMGHSEGDNLLKEIARRLKSACRESDYIARVGGDEFIVISAPIKDHFAASTLAKRILNTFTKPVRLAKKDVRATLSIGISMYPNAGTTAEALLKNADAAMYEAKINGKNDFEFFTESLNIIIQRQAEIELQLESAVANNELSLVFQPIMDIQKNKLVGVESLMRWHNQKMGQISPAEFIPLAERTGQIHNLTDWLLDTVCSNIKTVPTEKDTEFFNMLNINFSVIQLNKKSITKDITAFFDKYNIPPKNIVLEITETVLMENKKTLKGVLEELRELGYSIAIDDLGTGYSSLTSLKQLPITHLKIDKEFIQGIAEINNQAIVKAMIELGDLMDLIVIAEGIETVEQLDFLKKNNCKFAQGFYLSRPLSLELLDVFVKKYTMLLK